LRREEIRNSFKEAEEAEDTVASQMSADYAEKFEIAANQRQFFENASVCQDHFTELDFVSMASALQSKYREKLVKIPVEIGDFLKSSDFASIQIRMQSLDGRKSLNWSPQDKNMFRTCDSIVCSFFRRLKSEVYECASTQTIEASISFLTERLTIAHKALVLRNLASVDPVEMIFEIYKACELVHKDLEKRMKNALARYRFSAAAAFYDLMVKFGPLDRIFDNQQDMLSEVHLSEHLRESGPTLARELSEFTLNKFSEITESLFESAINSLEQKLTEDCKALLFTLPENAAASLNDQHRNPLVDHDASVDSKNASGGSPTKDFQQNLMTQGKSVCLPHSPELPSIDLVAIRRLRNLFKCLNDVADSNDPESLFHGRVQFDDIRDNLMDLITQHAQQIYGNIQKSIFQKKLQEAKSLLTSLERLSTFINEFDSVSGPQFIQHCTEQNEALKIARACTEVGIDAEMFSFIPAQVKKLNKHLQALKQDHYGKYVEAQNKIKKKFQEEARQLGLNLKPENVSVDSFERVFEFISGLMQYEEVISFLGNDEESMRLSSICKRNFEQYSTRLYFLFEDKLREGRNILLVNDEVSNLKHAAAESVQFAVGTSQNYLETLVTRCETLLEKCSKQLSNLKAAQEGLKQHELFALQDMNRMLETLKLLEAQSNSVAARTLDDAQQHDAGFDEVLQDIKNQLKNAISKVTDLLSAFDYAVVALGFSNIQALQNFPHLESECRTISKEIEKLIQQRYNNLLDQFCQEFKKRNYAALDPIIAEASKLDKAFSEKFSSTFGSLMEIITTEFRQALEEFLSQNGNFRSRSITDHTYVICKLKEIVSKISSLQIQEIVDLRIGSYIEELVRMNFDFYELGMSLVSQGAIGEEVTERYPQFQAVKTKRLNEAFKSAGITIDHALDGLANEPSNLSPSAIQELRSLYERYESKSNDLLGHYLPGFQSGFKEVGQLDNLVYSAQEIAKRVERRSVKNIKHCLLEILASVFTVWTVQTSHQMFVAQNCDSDCLIRPNVVQILALFRLLGLDSADGWWSSMFTYFTGKKEHKIEGHLIQVGTGEGKSILLGGLSCLLALLGYEVSCASYSKHLSRRDYGAFKALFDAFGVTSSIKYSTLSDLADSVVNSRGDVRDLVKRRIINVAAPDGFQMSPKSASCSSGIERSQSSQHQKRILIIDEVDVFFTKDFYGEKYIPALQLASDETRAIMEHIWTYKDTSPSLKNIQALPAYMKLLQKFCLEAKDLIDEQIRCMLQDVKNFNDPPYEIVDCEDGSKKIGYKALDSVSTSLTFGYKTAFAYLYESQRYSAMQVNVQLALEFQCGSFSYAEIPKQDFSSIMGVTGTLSSLSKAELSIVEDEYNIKKKTMMPSIYGLSKRKFLCKDIGVVVEFDLNRYYQLILKDIMDEQANGRAVLVFFESETKLKEFVASSYGTQLQDVNIVTERTENIPFYVSKASNAREVTFFPKVFGRGLDFVSRDQSVNKAGGIHVIQTFFSDFRSEEIQIMGRTARQAKDGSYKLIIFHESLAKYGLSEEDIKKVYPSTTFYEDFLMQKREERVGTLISELKDGAQIAKQMHELSQTFVTTLLDENATSKKVVDLLRPLQSGSQSTDPVHIVFCLDESGSMSNDWSGVVSCFTNFLQIRESLGATSDLVSVVQFSNSARVTMTRMPLLEAINNSNMLNFRGGGTLFSPALTESAKLLSSTQGMDAVIVFMTDGECSDGGTAPSAASKLAHNFSQGTLMFFGLAFKESVSTLRQITDTVPGGILLSATNVLQLRDQFQFIAKQTSARHVRS